MEVRFRELLSRLDAACGEGQYRTFLELLDKAYVRVSATERDAFRALFRGAIFDASVDCTDMPPPAQSTSASGASDPTLHTCLAQLRHANFT